MSYTTQYGDINKDTIHEKLEWMSKAKPDYYRECNGVIEISLSAYYQSTQNNSYPH